MLLALAAACAALAGVLGHRSSVVGARLAGLLHGPGGWAATEPGDVVSVLATGAGALVAGWYALTALAVLGARTRRGARPALVFLHRWGAPVLRRVALSGAAAGLGVTMAVGGAAATGGTAPPSAPPPDDLTWGTTGRDHIVSVPVGRPEPVLTPAPPARAGPDDPHGRERPSGDDAGRKGSAEGVDRPDCERHLVAPGDTLWSIAAAHLPAGASDADVAAEWPRWYAANTDVLGDDPHLIHPGQVLIAPEGQPS